jgi:hypothetical protein
LQQQKALTQPQPKNTIVKHPMSKNSASEIASLRLTPSTLNNPKPLQTIADPHGNAVHVFASPLRVELHENGQKACNLSPDQFNSLLLELRNNAGGELKWQEVDGSKLAAAPIATGRLKSLCRPIDPSDL